MKKLIIQQVCCIYPKNEYRRENDTFIKGNIHCISKDQIIEEYDDCWITLSQPVEVIGEVINKTVTGDNSWKGHYSNNIVHINVLYNKIRPDTYFMHHRPISMEAGMYNNKPVIKTKFILYSVIISEDSSLQYKLNK